MYENNPNESFDELLKQVKLASMQKVANGSGIDQMSLIMPPFSALIVKATKESSETAAKNIKVQNRMLLLTSIILAISIVQAAITFSQVFLVRPVNHPTVIAQPHAAQSESNNKEQAKKNSPVKPTHNSNPVQ